MSTRGDDAPDAGSGDSSATPPDPPPGWVLPPGGPDRPRRRRPLLVGCLLIGALLIVGPLIATAILDYSGSGTGIRAIGFGSGGSGCTLTGVASTFRLGDPVRNVVTFSPAVPIGDSITIKVEMNGSEILDRRETIEVDEPASCMQGTLSPLEVGHYRIIVEDGASSMPPISGEFDVTP